MALHQGRPKHNHNHNFLQKRVLHLMPHQKRNVMAHQMKHLCGFSVLHCVEGHLVRHAGVPQE